VTLAARLPSRLNKGFGLAKRIRDDAEKTQNSLDSTKNSDAANRAHAQAKGLSRVKV
jgi:hypothetical protein